MQLYYHYQGQAIQNNTEDQTSTSPATISKAPVLYPAEQFEECFAHLDMAGPPMAVHRLNAVNPPHLEPPRSLPSGSQQYMTSQSASGPAGEAQSRPESMVSDGDSFSYQGSPAPAHAWLTPAASPESSSVPSPQSCWSSTHHEADCLPQSWPAGQPQIPSYDMQLYMSTQGAEGTHESRSSATSTLQSQTNTIRHMNQGFGNDEDDEDTEDWNSLNGEEIDGNACYAKLLRLALMGSDRHAMALKDIYQWFRDHTNKPGLDPENKETKGWTNSVRHNLSMNHVST
ncbi:uncharacterized protein B0I36DRAFT_83182 [Microdochium trichocladiopsis]|uniref:Fork-head domain-containing protein n=1 Tax=Microdochium trichocladiopsis TaxID=1682393 RepID=A0A9P8YD08_9PEZI|nr:uncharacterized protein B0I36DRAFT_83182 [Microdochium trichocladiopsis]KAH7034691.1 hypothetical protein B0I36DRAFT_83182 [Microdochium trichocladiopsis]